MVGAKLRDENLSEIFAILLVFLGILEFQGFLKSFEIDDPLFEQGITDLISYV